jgi:hypothetical protein
VDSPAQAYDKSEAAADDAGLAPGRHSRAEEPDLPEDDEVEPLGDDDAVVLSREDADPASDDEVLAGMSSPNGTDSRGEPAPATSPPASAAAAQPDEAQLDEAQLDEAQLDEAQRQDTRLRDAQGQDTQLDHSRRDDSPSEAPAPTGAAVPAGSPSRPAAAGVRDVAAGGRTDQDPTGRWHEIQAAFVDDPRRSVELAAGLTDDSASALVTAVQDRLTALQSTWQGGDDDTEQLRSVLREYRDLWMRLGEFSVSA